MEERNFPLDMSSWEHTVTTRNGIQCLHSARLVQWVTTIYRNAHIQEKKPKWTKADCAVKATAQTNNAEVRKDYVNMATASAASYTSVDKHALHDVSSHGGGGKGPNFGMQKGCRIQPGKIFWQGRYVDQSQFYRVSNLDCIESLYPISMVC